MSHASPLIAADIDAYLRQHERKDLLRFLTCGSVDDGKSTLIGRLLHDSHLVYEDQLAAVKADSARYGTTGGMDLALLVDGLQAEREQGITIDVAYRYFSTAKRKFIIADTPGHEQYTRNMATGASTCDLAIILIDARNGVRTQTRRHTTIASLLGIRHIVVAVNKMDLVGHSEEVFERIRDDYSGFADRLGVEDVQFVPISALHGDNVVHPSTRMSWYAGSTLMHLLENVHIASDRNLSDLRFPVQYVNRPNADFRGYAGTIASGVLRRGDEVLVLPSRKTARVRSIVTYEGDLEEAFAPMAVTLTLDREVDVSRGDTIVHPDNLPHVDDRLEAMVVWMSEEPLRADAPYSIKHGTRTTPATFAAVRHRLNVDTLEQEPADALALNEIGQCTVDLAQPLVFDPYKANRATGAFVVIDRMTNNTVGAGMILDRGSELHPDVSMLVDESMRLTSRRYVSTIEAGERERRWGQRPVTILLTGLHGAGKRPVAYALERRLFDAGRLVQVLEGYNTHIGLSIDLAFTGHDCSENLRRVAEVARLFNDAGLILICALVVHSEKDRAMFKKIVGPERVVEVHASAPLEWCKTRDTSGLYEEAARGRVKHLPGVTVPYEGPATPDLDLPTHQLSVDDAVEKILELLRARGMIAN
jgi:bifunctional enzyme CysN/CysC